MLKQILLSLSPLARIGTPEPRRPVRRMPRPLPEQALPHGYDPTGPQFGPMWRDPESAVRSARIT